MSYRRVVVVRGDKAMVASGEENSGSCDGAMVEMVHTQGRGDGDEATGAKIRKKAHR